ncbi:MAG: flavohemoglobin expression-modulating QEGLA motif protein [Candidatus Scalindua sp.]|nr:flavohemoglobin expression-modulating QEGLA motif protein [Candidatus Scalindua sp.]
MQLLSERACIEAIKNGETFQAEIEGGSFSLKIDEYSFFICTAIHNGHRLRQELVNKCALDEAERLYEEDPFTGDLISSLPITLVALDSRYEYDLNRSPEQCVYERAWGKSVWSSPLTEDECKTSQHKHHVFYRILSVLLEKLQSQFGSCLIYDIHSYNYQRLTITDTPVFNIGTEQLNKHRWNSVIQHWNKTLNKTTLHNVDVRSATDEVFFGRGYLANFVRQHFRNTLVLPTEVKKIFMKENTGDVYPLVLPELKEVLKQSILKTALYFSKYHTNKNHSKKAVLLSSNLESSILNLDKQLYHLARGIETLTYINPQNIAVEKKRFFSKNYNYVPSFTYKHLDINPYEFREKLYRLPVDDIRDVSIQQFYRDVIDAYAIKVDLIASVGKEKFLYNSLRYYGEPSENDNKTAEFLLFAKEFEPNEASTIDAAGIRDAFLAAIDKHLIKCRVLLTDNIIANAMVKSTSRLILINRAACINKRELNALIHHELEVHMLTTVNSENQKLKIFRLGLPGNTCTQEGLAVLSEYMTGNLTLQRLKVLALRVIAVKMMIKDYDFSRTFKILVDDYALNQNEAFKITARVYRGGGFTKDFLYLRGLRMALQQFKICDISPLFVGKTSFEYLDIINELIQRKMIDPPVMLPYFLTTKKLYRPDKVLEYLLESMR